MQFASASEPQLSPGGASAFRQGLSRVAAQPLLVEKNEMEPREPVVTARFFRMFSDDLWG